MQARVGERLAERAELLPRVGLHLAVHHGPPVRLLERRRDDRRVRHVGAAERESHVAGRLHAVAREHADTQGEVCRRRRTSACRSPLRALGLGDLEPQVRVLHVRQAARGLVHARLEERRDGIDEIDRDPRQSERLDQDGLAGLDVAPVLLEHDGQLPATIEEDAGALRPRGPRLPATVLPRRMPRLNSRRPFRLLIGSTAVASAVSEKSAADRPA